jgi:hypothetical protein
MGGASPPWDLTKSEYASNVVGAADGVGVGAAVHSIVLHAAMRLSALSSDGHARPPTSGRLRISLTSFRTPPPHDLLHEPAPPSSGFQSESRQDSGSGVGAGVGLRDIW